MPLNWFTTPQQLADHLDVDEKYVRHALRESYPEVAPGKGRRWDLTPTMCATVITRANAMKHRRAMRAGGHAST